MNTFALPVPIERMSIAFDHKTPARPGLPAILTITITDEAGTGVMINRPEVTIALFLQALSEFACREYGVVSVRRQGPEPEVSDGH